MADLNVWVPRGQYVALPALPSVAPEASESAHMILDADCARVHELYRLSGRPPLETQSPAEAREAMLRARAILQPDAPQVGEVRDIVAAGPAGPIPLRIYRPAGETRKRLPGLIYFHGGGWVIGDLDSHDTLCRELCEKARIAVVSVHYRLAPEHRFPAAVDDAIAATADICSRAEELQLDPERIAVGGDSAGGNLAAVVCIGARNSGRPRLAFQLLIYPAVDATFSMESHQTRGEVLPLTRGAITWFKDHYLGADTKNLRDWRVSPMFAETLAGLPPAYVLTAGFDVLCDEGLEYARRLASAGVNVRTLHMPGMIHGFITMGRIVAGANEAVAECARALERQLRP